MRAAQPQPRAVAGRQPRRPPVPAPRLPRGVSPRPQCLPTLSMVVWLAMPMRSRSTSGSKPSLMAFLNLDRKACG